MKNLKKLGLSFTLILVLAVAAFAGDPISPPCAPDPGITSTPPCAAAQMMPEEFTPQTSAPNSPNPVDEYSVLEVAIDLVQHWLSIY